MTIQRMDSVGIVVEDLEAATAFFVARGLELEGEMPVEGRWVDRILGLDDVQARLQAHGAELVGEVEQYEDSYRLCHVRGPGGIIVALAEQLG